MATKSPTPARGLQGQTAEDRTKALASRDPKVRASGMSRAELRIECAKAGVTGAANLRRADAERLYVEHVKSGKPLSYACDAKGRVTKVTAAAKPAPAKKATTRKAPATRAATKPGKGRAKASPKAEGADPPQADGPAPDAPPDPSTNGQVTEKVGDATIAVDAPADASA